MAESEQERKARREAEWAEQQKQAQQRDAELGYVEGNVYWSLQNDSEAMNYADPMAPLKPRQPWQGKLRKDQNPGGIVYYLNAFSSQTGEMDDDPNAFAIVGYADNDRLKIFKTFAEARAAYITAVLQYIEDVQGTLNEVARELVQYMSRTERQTVLQETKRELDAQRVTERAEEC